MPEELTAPFPYFGGKARIAELVWLRLGNARTYIEPFAGSLAVLLRRPHAPFYEVANDLNGEVMNVWRAITFQPKQTAAMCNWPRSEIDVLARRKWYSERLPALVPLLAKSPMACDVDMAAYWVWGSSTCIGHNWNFSTKAALPTFPYGRGVHRILPLEPTKAIQGIPINGSFDATDGEIFRQEKFLLAWFNRLASRLRKVSFTCGDWKRVLTRSFLNEPKAGIFLDPPYNTHEKVYHRENNVVSKAVQKWARTNGSNPDLRIAICGYDGDYVLPGWECIPWKTKGGYGSHSQDGSNANSERERIWFSPNCHRVSQTEI
jgi:DNA adenine methylase